MIKAEVLFINIRLVLFLSDGYLINKKIKPNPVIKKNINNINRPLDGSDANVWTLVRIPDLTKTVPNILKEI